MAFAHSDTTPDNTLLSFRDTLEPYRAAQLGNSSDGDPFVMLSAFVPPILVATDALSTQIQGGHHGLQPHVL
jgi:hypothetical protein